LELRLNSIVLRAGAEKKRQDVLLFFIDVHALLATATNKIIFKLAAHQTDRSVLYIEI
jgi:hypothetical protein